MRKTGTHFFATCSSAEAFEKALNTKCGTTQSGFLDFLISRAYADDRVCTVSLELLNGEHLDIDKEVLEALQNGLDNYKAEKLQEFANLGWKLIQNKDVLLQSQISDEDKNTALQILSGLKYVSGNFSNKSDDIAKLYNSLSDNGKRYLFGLLAQEDANRQSNEQKRLADKYGVIQNAPANFWKDSYTGWGIQTFILQGGGVAADINGLFYNDIPENSGVNPFTNEVVNRPGSDRAVEYATALFGSLAGSLTKVVKRGDEVVEVVTGARKKEIPYWDFDEAEKVYDLIRASKDDVADISKNTGMQLFSIQRIKNHLFYNTHKLDDGLIARFDADPLIANAWNRLRKGTFTDADIKLLNHELFESKFEGIFKTDYRCAHCAANKSGRPSGLEQPIGLE